MVAQFLHDVRAAQSNVYISARSRGLEATFVFVFSLLRPENLLQHDSSDHHSNNEEPGKDQNRCHDTADDLNRSGVESLAYGERRRY